MKTKRLLCPQRLRTVPHQFSWIDQRLVREGHIARCGGAQALALYLLRVQGKWVYFYRAVDSTGATIDFLLSPKRDAEAAERFLAKTFGRREPSGAAGHQHRQARRLSTGHRAAQSRGRSEGELPTSTGAVPQ
jgi:hypothetical protein